MLTSEGKTDLFTTFRSVLAKPGRGGADQIQILTLPFPLADKQVIGRPVKQNLSFVNYFPK